jgi:CubicO group peptidase (beta-lactamase class C family)
MTKIIFTTTLSIVLFGSLNAQMPPTSISEGIDALFQNHVNQSKDFVPGQVIRIEKRNEWVYEKASGVGSIVPSVVATSDMKFKIASITKLFTSAAIFKLIQAGTIDFNAPISNYLPLAKIQGFDSYQNITIKKLLSHTSGINEPQSDFQGRLNYWIYMKRFENIPIDSLIFWSYANPRGVGNYNYSNANFYLLAEIIQSVSGMSYQNYITKNIISPLGLSNTNFNTIPNGLFMKGYLKGSFYPIGGVINGGLAIDSLYNFTEASNSWGYGGADLWSNTIDLIKFHKALFGGQLINERWLDTMKIVTTNTGDMGSYGHGMIQFKSYNNGPIYGFGHTGSAFGYGSMLCYIPGLDLYICSAGNYMKIGQEFLQRDIYNFLANTKSNISDIEIENSINIYPNPIILDFEIKTDAKKISYEIYNLQGKIVQKKELSSSSEVQKINELEKGIYIIKITTDSEKTIFKKILKG